MFAPVRPFLRKNVTGAIAFIDIILEQSIVQPVRSEMIMMIVLRNGCWLTKGVKPYFQSRTMSQIPTTANLRHATRMIRTWAEPEFWLWWRKLCRSDNHYAVVPQIIMSYHTMAPQTITWIIIYLIIIRCFKWIIIHKAIGRCFITHFTIQILYIHFAL